MSTEFDAQLIEAVSVRRDRLMDALLFGANPTERRWRSTLRLFLYSVVIAALIAAICVGISFVTHILEQQAAEKAQRESSAVVHWTPLPQTPSAAAAAAAPPSGTGA
ncbi:hypothetical protein [Zhihengliuella sp.]|uniref:hypothetical protein n=1 Tax=Zhihengliuella sp. TaxID=1954483 RepID=UPI0028110D3C|nr:hypothetical protein [Zhihengliuella sp.]